MTFSCAKSEAQESAKSAAQIMVFNGLGAAIFCFENASLFAKIFGKPKIAAAAFLVLHSIVVLLSFRLKIILAFP